MTAADPTRGTVERIVRALGRKKLYYKPITSTLSTEVIKAIQRSVVTAGYTGSITGTLNTDTKKAMKSFAKIHETYHGSTSGDLDQETWAAYLHALKKS